MTVPALPLAPLRDTPLEDLPALLLPALGQTALMVVIVVPLTLVIGTVLAIILFNVSPFGLFPRPVIHTVLSTIINIGRSLPFLVLMAAVIPFTRLVMGTSLGVAGAIIPLTLGAVPMFVRLMESTLRGTATELTDVARSMRASTLMTIGKFQIAESVPGIITNLTIAIVSIVDFTAVAGAIGAGGIGFLAIAYGYQRFDNTVMLATVVTLVVITQVIQFTGDRLARAATR